MCYNFTPYILSDNMNPETEVNMKKYIRSSYTYDPWKNADMSEWSDEDIATWESIDWKSRQYYPMTIDTDTFEDYLDIYGVPTEDGDYSAHELVTFVKRFSANTIYPPSFVVAEDDWNAIVTKYKKLGYSIVGPMYDGTTVEKDGVTYKVMDRADTQELYDTLSR